MQQIEHSFSCPSCNAPISVLLDVSEEGEQERIEDCEVCCRPMALHVNMDNQEVTYFEATTTD